MTDFIAVEEPLEIRVSTLAPNSQSTDKRTYKTLTITMRTPGHDEDLALGFLFTEKIIQSRKDVIGIFPCGPILNQAQSRNVIRIDLSFDFNFENLASHFKRNFISNSSCGVCGKTSLEFFRDSKNTCIRIPEGRSEINQHNDFKVSSDLLVRLPSLLNDAQALFNTTGGLHASAIFSLEGKMIHLREDVGRHNALDKVIGSALLQGLLPLDRTILLVSGRVSFELVQKAALAGIRILAAIGAPSSLAIELAQEAEMTLIGFIKKNQFNTYCGEWRIEI